MSSKTALVTGAYGAIGKAIAQGIAALPAYSVVLLGRDRAALDRATEEVRRRAGNPHVRSEVVDLSRRDSIHALSEGVREPVSVLVNNAATTPPRRQQTPEGLEMQFATNVMGYFWMMDAFEASLREGEQPRVVNVASYWAGDVDLDDLQLSRRRYDNDTAYRQSKAADRMLTVAFAERFRDAGIAVNACHPGDVRSKLSRSLGFGGHESPEAAAETPLALATTSLGYEHTGKYFQHGQPVACRFGADAQKVKQLYETCATFR